MAQVAFRPRENALIWNRTKTDISSVESRTGDTRKRWVFEVFYGMERNHISGYVGVDKKMCFLVFEINPLVYDSISEVLIKTYWKILISQKLWK